MFLPLGLHPFGLGEGLHPRVLGEGLHPRGLGEGLGFGEVMLS